MVFSSAVKLVSVVFSPFWGMMDQCLVLCAVGSRVVRLLMKVAAMAKRMTLFSSLCFQSCIAVVTGVC